MSDKSDLDEAILLAVLTSTYVISHTVIFQFARIHTSSLIKIEKILNKPITKFYNSDDVMGLRQSYRSLK